jgi:hypothetical protein
MEQINVSQEPLYCVTSGVCDSPQQYATLYPDIDRVIYFAIIRRTDQAPDGGWRWHKWGKYVGNYNISNIEYLFEADGESNRPLIDLQYLFSSYPYEIFGIDQFIGYSIKNGEANKIGIITYPMIEQSRLIFELISDINTDDIEQIFSDQKEDIEYFQKSMKNSDPIIFMNSLDTLWGTRQKIFNYFNNNKQTLVNNNSSVFDFFKYVALNMGLSLMYDTWNKEMHDNIWAIWTKYIREDTNYHNVIKFYFDLDLDSQTKLITLYNNQHEKRIKEQQKEDQERIAYNDKIERLTRYIYS